MRYLDFREKKWNPSGLPTAAYLFKELSAAYDYGWIVSSLLLFIVIIAVLILLLKIPGYDEFELPSRFLPDIINTWYPAPRGIR